MGSAAVAVTLPALADDLQLSTGGASWVISLYALMLAVTTAVYGRRQRPRSPRRRPRPGGPLLVPLGPARSLLLSA